MPRAPLQRAEEKKEDFRLATATTMAGDSAVSERPAPRGITTLHLPGRPAARRW
jgi:hypothetical protein